MKPEDFNKLVENLKAQDPRCTSDPLFCVEQKDRTYGLDPFHHYDDYIWVDRNDSECSFDSSDDLKGYLIENSEHVIGALSKTTYYEDYNFPEIFDDESLEALFEEHSIYLENDDEIRLGGYDFDKCYFEERYVYVNAHLTEAAALLFIKQNKHNLTEPRTYVTSQYRCWEWNALREALMSGQLILKENS